MNMRELYVKTLLYEKCDRVPLLPGGPRESTLRTWRTQGLGPEENYWDAVLDAIGLPPMPEWLTGIEVSQRMMPEFEEKVLEHRDGVLVVQDWMGAIVEISDEFDVTYLRSAKDFVTRSWLKCPVENRADWENMRERYKLGTPGRVGEIAETCRVAREKDQLVTIQFNGPFWQLREWWGFEGLCLAFIEQPELVREQIEFWTEFVASLLERIFREGHLDRLGISEDMAYKAHAMISPAMTRDFLVPAYRRWSELARANNCPLVDMDSDGFIEELIPVWLEGGINVCDPIEVAAGNDLVRMRQNFGRRIAYTGGIDKRKIAAGGQAMRDEVLRVVPPLYKEGGYIPGCDHAVPSDISWSNFIEYTRLLAQLNGWL